MTKKKKKKYEIVEIIGGEQEPEEPEEEKKPLRAPIIAIEGPDGAGKSNLCKDIAEYYAKSEYWNKLNNNASPKVVHVPSEEFDDVLKVRETAERLELTTPHQIQSLMIQNIKMTYSRLAYFRKYNPMIPIILDRWIISNIVYSYVEHNDLLFDMKERIHGFNVDKKQFDTLDIKDIYGLFYFLPKALMPDLVINIHPTDKLLEIRSNYRKENEECRENDTNLDKICFVSDVFLNIFNQLAERRGCRKYIIPDTIFANKNPEWWENEKSGESAKNTIFTTIVTSTRKKSLTKEDNEKLCNETFKEAKKFLKKLEQ